MLRMKIGSIANYNQVNWMHQIAKIDILHWIDPPALINSGPLATQH
jgi:hypothetical protein